MIIASGNAFIIIGYFFFSLSNALMWCCPFSIPDVIQLSTHLWMFVVAGKRRAFWKISTLLPPRKTVTLSCESAKQSPPALRGSRQQPWRLSSKRPTSHQSALWRSTEHRSKCTRSSNRVWWLHWTSFYPKDMVYALSWLRMALVKALPL